MTFGQVSWILDLIRVGHAQILPLHGLVVLLVVADVLVLQGLDDAFEVFRLLWGDRLVRQGFLRDVSVIIVDTLVLVLHLDITSDRRIGDNFLERRGSVFFNSTTMLRQWQGNNHCYRKH